MGERSFPVGQPTSLDKTVARLEAIRHNQDGVVVLGGAALPLLEEA